MIESDIEKHLVQRCKDVGAECRKLKWIERNGAPDRIVMFNGHTVFVELKAPGLGKSFPTSPHERQQKREHDRLRAVGQWVVVLDDKGAIDDLLESLV